MKTIHKVCHYLREIEGLARNLSREKFVEFSKCKECPAWESLGKMGKGKAGCRMGAEEMISIVKYGQPWGRKYRNSRRQWPN